MTLKCIKTVKMVDSGDIEFTEGKEYVTSKKQKSVWINEEYKDVEVLIAVNNSGSQHTIKNFHTDELDKFYIEHFREV